ncbi:HAD-IA family hydrolase [Chelatococcus sp. SYSU_G07232]|uniref:HAD-IA family hydrolase n=1 Tax=Chelatococcus albus TaxID=3047466 RepID=A0ABT7AH55_9HYPH|nr:HAD-IA family hydrolase [Chelatococcus sp. SYSU_G07232]MDJ1158703.1 HAD-IA family hydrolase [Chelatococcus sp. SYSU_G07232]
MTAIPTAPALLFDLDGTLAATDHLHFETFRALMAEFGRDLDMATYETTVLGRANSVIMQTLFPDLPESEHRRIADRKEAAFRERAAGKVQPMPGLLDLLAWADRREVPCALVTNAPRANAEAMLAALGLEGRFRTLVIGDEVGRAKPDPLPYLTGLERLGAAAERSVAFEDSISGVTSAAAAGLPVVGLTTSLAAEPLLAAGASFAASNYIDPRIYALLETRLAAAEAA